MLYVWVYCVDCVVFWLCLCWLVMFVSFRAVVSSARIFFVVRACAFLAFWSLCLSVVCFVCVNIRNFYYWLFNFWGKIGIFLFVVFLIVRVMAFWRWYNVCSAFKCTLFVGWFCILCLNVCWVVFNVNVVEFNSCCVFLMFVVYLCMIFVVWWIFESVFRTRVVFSSDLSLKLFARWCLWSCWVICVCCKLNIMIVNLVFLCLIVRFWIFWLYVLVILFVFWNNFFRASRVVIFYSFRARRLFCNICWYVVSVFIWFLVSECSFCNFLGLWLLLFGVRNLGCLMCVVVVVVFSKFWRLSYVFASMRFVSFIMILLFIIVFRMFVMFLFECMIDVWLVFVFLFGLLFFVFLFLASDWMRYSFASSSSATIVRIVVEFYYFVNVFVLVVMSVLLLFILGNDLWVVYILWLIECRCLIILFRCASVDACSALNFSRVDAVWYCNVWYCVIICLGYIKFVYVCIVFCICIVVEEVVLEELLLFVVVFARRCDSSSSSTRRSIFVLIFFIFFVLCVVFKGKFYIFGVVLWLNLCVVVVNVCMFIVSWCIFVLLVWWSVVSDFLVLLMICCM